MDLDTRALTSALVGGLVGGATVAAAVWSYLRRHRDDAPGSTLPSSPYAPEDKWSRVVHDNFCDPTLWEGLRTHSGLSGDLVVAALQKEIRRGGNPENEENACRLAFDLLKTSPAAEDKLWQRLLVISAEDVGFGNPQAAAIVNALHTMAKSFRRDEGDRPMMAIYAVRTLCKSTKDRSNDELLTWLNSCATKEERQPTIPDYAYDKHTAQGQAMGRGSMHFFTHATKLIPEMQGRELKWRTRVMSSLS